jgi:hypothetical protein
MFFSFSALVNHCVNPTYGALLKQPDKHESTKPDSSILFTASRDVD